MKIFRVQRQTEDWSKLDFEKFWNRSRKNIFLEYTKNKERARLLKQNMELWERLSIDYFQFRQHLKEVANRHMKFMNTISISDTWDNMMEGSCSDVILVPMDDDDILHPNIMPVLHDKFQNPQVKALEWKTWTYDSLRAKERFYVEPDPTPSNCYAIRGNCAKGLLVTHVVFAYSNIEREKLEDKLALRYVHRASTHFMQRERINPNQRLQKTDVIPELQWASGIIEEWRSYMSSMISARKLLHL